MWVRTINSKKLFIKQYKKAPPLLLSIYAGMPGNGSHQPAAGRDRQAERSDYRKTYRKWKANRFVKNAIKNGKQTVHIKPVIILIFNDRNGLNMNHTSKITVLMLTLIATLGCNKQVIKEWQPVGGSRSDATIKLSYQYQFAQTPQVNEQQGLSIAKSKCIKWGYSDAEAFGAETTLCQNYDSYLGCTLTLVTKEYQCLGLGNIEN